MHGNLGYMTLYPEMEFRPVYAVEFWNGFHIFFEMRINMYHVKAQIFMRNVETKQ